MLEESRVTTPPDKITFKLSKYFMLLFNACSRLSTRCAVEVAIRFVFKSEYPGINSLSGVNEIVKMINVVKRIKNNPPHANTFSGERIRENCSSKVSSFIRTSLDLCLILEITFLVFPLCLSFERFSFFILSTTNIRFLGVYF